MGCGTSRSLTVQERSPPRSLPRSNIFPQASADVSKPTDPPALENDETTASKKEIECTHRATRLPPIVSSSNYNSTAPVDTKDPHSEIEGHASEKASGAGVAFVIPLSCPPASTAGISDSLVQRYPPRRFQSLAESQPLTLQSYHLKQTMVERRRQQIISRRVQSARYRNLRSAGRVQSRDTARDDSPIESGIGEAQREFATEIT